MDPMLDMLDGSVWIYEENYTEICHWVHFQLGADLTKDS